MKYIIFIGFLLFALQTPNNVSAQWSQVNGSFLHIKCFDIFDSSIFSGSNRTVVRSTDNGTSWNKSNYGLSGLGTYALAHIDTIIFAGSDGNGVYRSYDSGISWRRANNGLKNMYVKNFAISGTTLFEISQSKGVFRSFDYGDNWIEADSGLPRTYFIMPRDSILFAGTDSGVFLSKNSGVNWNQAINNGLKKAFVTTLALNGKYLYAGTFRGVFRSNDDGTNWTQLNNGLKDTLVHTLLINGSILLAATIQGGLFRSIDSGSHWTFISKDINDSNITSLTVNDKYLFAGTENSGIWRRPLSDFSIVNQQNSGENKELVLHPNYPNPFSNRTSISFSTSKREFINVKVFDILGKEKADIFSGELDAGEHSYEWNNSHLPSGAYTCIIRAADGTTAEQSIIIH